MKIVITENQYNRLTGEIDEALGVPEGILEAGEEIYDLIIEKLNKFNGDIEDLNNNGFIINEKFKISDHIFEKIIVKFDIEEHSEAKNADMVGMSSENESELTDTFVFRSVRDPKQITIGFKFYIEPGKGIDSIKEYLIKYRKEDISSLTHELKHAFRDVKEKSEPLSKRADYNAIQSIRNNFGFIPEINEFMYNSYFIHAIENVVRPTEMAAELRINNVSKKEFLKFFLNTEIVKRLKQIQNFSYEELKTKLHSKENIEKIKQLLEHLDIEDVDLDNDDEVVNSLLRLVFVNLINKKNDLVNQFLTTSFMDVLMGLTGEKDKFFRKYVAQTTKYKYDYDAFFKNEEKYFHKVATMMIKKLSKLYSMLKSE